MDWTDIVGWLGAVLLLAAYLSLSLGYLSAHCYRFHVMNLFAGLGMMVNTWVNGAYPATLVNVVWAVIAVLAMVRIWQKNNS